jgi:two-component system, OmpR family, KDP operon response regulator KdpE
MKTERIANQRPKVLVIEGDPEMRFSLRATLLDDYCLHEATTGSDGVALAGTLLPDLILLDLELPDMDGMEVLRQMRQEERTLPIVVLSEHATELRKIVALDAGADDFVSKPIDAFGELLARVRVRLRQAGARQQHARKGVSHKRNARKPTDTRQRPRRSLE